MLWLGKPLVCIYGCGGENAESALLIVLAVLLDLM